MNTLIIGENELQKMISPIDVMRAVEQAFVDFTQGEITMSQPSHFALEERGIVHIKNAMAKNGNYCIKIASYFPQNSSKNLSNIQGLMIYYEGETGFPLCVFLDNALLTHHRTAAAGAISSKFLSRLSSHNVSIFGNGRQAKMQLDYLTYVREIKSVYLCGKNMNHLASCIDTMRLHHPTITFHATTSEYGNAVAKSDIIITTTPSREPLINPEWIKKGTHIVAIGSDNAGKQELDPRILLMGKYITDSTEQCRKYGELQHEGKINLMQKVSVYGEIGEIIGGSKIGRQNDDEITLFDSTGLGAQDLAITQVMLDSLMKSK